MKNLLLAVICSLVPVSSVSAFADPPAPPAKVEVKDGRLVPTMQNGKLIGMKVYAIVSGGRFDQPTARFENGDVIESVDELPVTEESGQLALVERVVHGKADATVVVLRHAERVVLHSKLAR